MYAHVAQIQFNSRTKRDLGAGPHTLECDQCHKLIAEGDEILGPRRNRDNVPIWSNEYSPKHYHKYQYYHADCKRPQGFRTGNANNGPATTTQQVIVNSANTDWQRGTPASDKADTTSASLSAIPSVSAGADNADMIGAIIAAIQGNILPQLETITDNIEAKLDSHIQTNLAHNVAGQITSIASMLLEVKDNARALDTRVEALEATRPVVFNIAKHDGTTRTISVGVTHKKFPLLVKFARSFENAQRNLWLSGPTGSGKTHAAEQLTEILFADCECERCTTNHNAVANHYYFTGAIDTEYKLSGFIDANGTVHNTQFKLAWQHGGVFLFDEVDRSFAGALLKFNAALSNAYCDFPDGMHKRHPDCYILAAANTWGFGGDANYVGANKLDAAFLSRFPVKISWGYDEDLEHLIAGNSLATDWVTAVQAARRNAFAAKAKVIFDPRQSMAGGQLMCAGLLTRAEIAEGIFGMYAETLATYDTICKPILDWVRADVSNAHMSDSN